MPLWPFGTIVKADSADPGLEVNSVPIDADHLSLTKPASKDDQVYILIRQFIEAGRSPDQPSSISDSISWLARDLDAGFSNISRDTLAMRSELSDFHSLFRQHEEAARPSSAVVDQVAIDRLMRLRRLRFYGGISQIEEAQKLSDAVLHGDLAAASIAVKGGLLGWAARLLAQDDRQTCQGILDHAKGRFEAVELEIARALCLGFHGNMPEAMSILDGIGSPGARSAQIFLKDVEGSDVTCSDWFEAAGLSFEEIDSDGKLKLLIAYMNKGEEAQYLDLVGNLTDADFQNTPALLRLASDALLLASMPAESKNIILKVFHTDLRKAPFNATPEAIERRRRAAEFSQRSARAARDLGEIDFAKFDEDRVLWLKLRDPSTQDSARDELRESLADDDVFIRRIPMASDFGVRFEISRAERLLEREEARAGKTSLEVALARYHLAMRQPDPAAVAAYLEKHREKITNVLEPSVILSGLIEMHARSGAQRKAEDALTELKSLDVSAEQVELLEQLVQGDFERLGPVAVFRDRYQRSGTLENLSNLVRALRDEQDWPQLASFGALLFEHTKDLADAVVVGEALYNSGQLADLIDFLSSNETLVNDSAELQSIWAWTSFRAGNFLDAEQRCRKLLRAASSSDHRTLLVYILLHGGKWGELSAFVESEWEQRDSRTNQELLRAAQLAQASGSPRLRELVFEAAKRANDDPAILIGCYQLAVEASWEADEGVGNWMARAADLSGEEGPIQRKSLKELLDLQPGWERQRDQALQQIEQSAIPHFLAAQMLKRSLVEITLSAACRNRGEEDIRRRSCIWAFAYPRSQPDPIDTSVLALDPISLLNLQMTKMLRPVLDATEKLIVPHSTLAWLFNERRRIKFHQPSRIATARRVVALYVEGKLRRFTASVVPPVALIKEVGREVAEALSFAAADTSKGETQIFYVRSGLIYRAGSLMDQEADLGEFAEHVTGCSAIVLRLREQGIITQSEASSALSFLTARGAREIAEVAVPSGSTVILDEPTTDHLSALGLLGKLEKAGLTPLVTERALTEAKALIALDDCSTEVEGHIESLRTVLSEAIMSGSVIVGADKAVEGDSDDDSLSADPSIRIIELAEHASALISDDRYFNSHSNLELGTKTVPIFSSADLIHALHENNQITSQAFDDWRAEMRAASFMYLIPTTDEIVRLITTAVSTSSKFSETAELRAVRESIIKLRQSGGVRLPADVVYISETANSIRASIPEIWKIDSIPTDAAYAASKWLFSLFDVRDWLHILDGLSLEQANSMHANFTAMLILLAPSERESEYWEWLSAVVLEPMKTSEPEIYEALLEFCSSFAADLLEKLAEEEGES
jgi:hypothetical protein